MFDALRNSLKSIVRGPAAIQIAVHQPGPALTLGMTQRSGPVTVGQPAIIHAHGAVGSGLRTFLLSLAEELIEQGAGLIYVDTYGTRSTYEGLCDIAVAAKRPEVPRAWGPGDGGDLAQAAANGDVVWYGMDALSVDRGAAQGQGEALMKDLAEAACAIDRAIKRPLAIILDGIEPLLTEHRTAFNKLVDQAISHGATLVVSGQGTRWLDARFMQAATCCVLPRVFGDDYLRLTDAYPLKTTTEVVGHLQPGEAIVCSRAGAEPVEHFVRLRYPDVETRRMAVSHVIG